MAILNTAISEKKRQKKYLNLADFANCMSVQYQHGRHTQSLVGVRRQKVQKLPAGHRLILLLARKPTTFTRVGQ